MNVAVYRGVGHDAPPVGIVEISETIDQRTLCEAALIPIIRKEAIGWTVVGWQLVPRTSVDTKYVELT